MTRLAALVLAVLATSSAERARAQPPDDGASAEEAPSVDRVEQLAREVRDRALAIAHDVSGSAIVASTISLDERAPDSAGLARRLVAPLLSALRSNEQTIAVDTWNPSGDDLETIARRAAMRDYDLLFHLGVQQRDRLLVLRIDVVRAARGRGLMDLFVPAPEPIGSTTLERAMDAHFDRYAGSTPQVTAATITARALPLPSRGYLAVVGADLDGDGSTELVLARPAWVDVVRVGRSRRGAPRLVRVGSVSVGGIAAPPSRIRRPIATGIAAHRSAVIRSSERGAAYVVRLDAGRPVVAPVEPPVCPDEGFPLEDACAVPVTGRDYFHQAVVARSGGASPAEAPSGFYARGVREAAMPDGSVLRVEAVVTPRGRLAVRAGEHAGGAVGYGAALGMADLDHDGLVELLVSSGAPIGDNDRLSVLRVRADGGVIAVWSGEPIGGSVLVAGATDLDRDGREELLAIEEPAAARDARARLWVVE